MYRPADAQHGSPDHERIRKSEADAKNQGDACEVAAPENSTGRAGMEDSNKVEDKRELDSRSTGTVDECVAVQDLK